MDKNKKMTITLVGTYRKACKKWIQEKMLYNYPIAKTGDRNFNPEIITHLFLHNGKMKLLKFGASLLKTVGVSELKALGYPVSDKPQSDKYALFALTPYSAGDAGVKRTKSSKSICYDQFIVSLSDFIAKDEDKAILSHWVHNKETPFAKSYEKRVKKLLSKELMDYFTRGNVLCESAVQQTFFPELFDVPFPPPENPKFTFVDLFAGIGGFRIAMQRLGGKCVFSSEWDEAAKKSYLVNYGEVPFGDITKDEVKAMIPEKFDILCGGFPCQAFSIAGYREGFNDKKNRGNLFFDIAQIINEHKPRAFLLENVKNLKAHDGGKTYTIIEEALRALGYHVKAMVLNTMEYGNVPQNRERIYIVGFSDPKIAERFEFPKKTPLTRTIHDCLINGVNPKYYYLTDKQLGRQLDDEIKRKDTVYQWRRIYVRENKNNVCPTLTANMGMGGHNVPLIRDDKGVRKLTPRECANFQGYPESFILPSIADSSLYKQFGNSVSIPVLERVVHNMRRAIDA